MGRGSRNSSQPPITIHKGTVPEIMAAVPEGTLSCPLLRQPLLMKTMNRPSIITCVQSARVGRARSPRRQVTP